MPPALRKAIRRVIFISVPGQALGAVAFAYFLYRGVTFDSPYDVPMWTALGIGILAESIALVPLIQAARAGAIKRRKR
jgi:hypothetical protein